MKIIVEDKIPYIQDAIKAISSDVVYLSAAEFCQETICDADVLIVRTRVKCNEFLLRNTRVKFIATATIGFDHIDIDYCKKMGICWTNAPGCNSASVCQYIHSTLVLIKQKYQFNLSNLTLGIIGVGHVGSKVEALARNLNMHVLLNDPIRRDSCVDFVHTELSEICQKADIISFHVPLTDGGPYPTYHLLDLDFLSLIKDKNPIIINTSRGEVIDSSALKVGLKDGIIKQAVLDVWENEPNIDLEILKEVLIATPHIAGYSADGKTLATQMSLQAVSDYFKLGLVIHIDSPLPIENSNLELTAKCYDEAVLLAYNPEVDSNALKADPINFEFLRSNYYIRRELSAYRLVIQ